MKASYRWLLELLAGNDPPAEVPSAEEVARYLTSGGLEVEGIARYGEACDKALVARVTAKEPHPQRAKLTLVTVDLGTKSQRVVCGAPNVPEVGGLVVLAPLGTHLPAKGLTLEPREIAGIVSEGMLCSESELGLRISGGEAGILILPDGLAAPGTPLSKAIPESHDVVFEINLTPNRPDGLGHIGLARDLAAVMGRPFGHVAPRPRRPSASKIASAVEITVEDGERCPTYGAALVEDVKVGPSPLGSQYRLEALGVRAISNVVDVTNLVMLKYGHPIHAFDLELVGQKKIVVRRAVPGEKLETLDGVERKLDPDDLVIADGEKPVALAGVMGGQGSGIRDVTANVLIECAYFTTRGIRRSARRHGMHTESSHRFERGVDPGDIVDVLAETSALLESLASGRASGDTVMVGPGVPPAAPIPLRRDKLDGLLGIAVPMTEAKAILERLGCREVSGGSDPDALSFLAPSHRPDLTIEADLIEEVVRVYGIDRVRPVVPSIRPQTPRTNRDLTARVVRAAIEVGLSQTLTFGFTNENALELLGAPPSGFKLMNPLTDDRSVMRTSLLPGLFDALRRARRHGVQKARLFATGARFLSGGPAPLAREAKSFAAVIAGTRDAVLSKAEPIDVYDAKGIALEIVARATGRDATVRAAGDRRTPVYHPRAAGELCLGDVVVGAFGMLHPELEKKAELDGTAAVIELDLEALAEIGAQPPRYKPIPSLPAATRDIALVVSDDVLAGDVAGAIRKSGGDLVESVELFDLFRGGSIQKDHRSLAFHVVYRDPKAATDPDNARTLTDVEVDERHKAVLAEVNQRFGATLRG